MCKSGLLGQEGSGVERKHLEPLIKSRTVISGLARTSREAYVGTKAMNDTLLGWEPLYHLGGTHCCLPHYLDYEATVSVDFLKGSGLEDEGSQATCQKPI